MLCAKIEPMVHGLAEDYAGKMKFEVRSYNEGDSPDRITRYGLDVHGMVITDAADKVQWSESGHKQTRAGVQAAVDKLLGG